MRRAPSAGLPSLAENIAQKEADVAALEEKLKDAKKALLRLTDEELPLLMTEMGVSSFKLSDGSQVEIKKIYGASIPVASREEAFAWLREQRSWRHGEKRSVGGFWHGRRLNGGGVQPNGNVKGLHPDQKESVHPSTPTVVRKGTSRRRRGVPYGTIRGIYWSTSYHQRSEIMAGKASRQKGRVGCR